jgi:transposase
VRDLVRCRETFQREILKSRHYLLRFLRRRGLVYRDGTNWSLKHFEWIRRLLAQNQVQAEDHAVLSGYELDRRAELDGRIGKLALEPAHKPTEHSSGERRRQGAITKCGNSHCRHVLVQAAYQRRPALSAALKGRQRGQSPQVVAHAWKPPHRVSKLFARIAARKSQSIAAAAAARELVGFL